MTGMKNLLSKERINSYFPYVVMGLFLSVLYPLVPPYGQSLMVHILIYSIFGVGVNLLIGYMGLFSMGHQAFFGIAAYTTAILMTRFDITLFWVTFPSSIIVAALIAAICGVIALRLSGVYFLFATIALSLLLVNVAQKWITVTKGSTGITGVTYPNLGFQSGISDLSFYYLVLVIFFLTLFLVYRLVKSPFGYAMQGIRDNETLMRHLGYNTWSYKFIIFIVAGAISGAAGALFGHFTSLAHPSYLDLKMTLIVILGIVLGGPRFVFGPIVGITLILVLQYYGQVYFTERVPLILGIAFVVCVMFLKGGVSVHLMRLVNKFGYKYGSIKS